MVFDNWKIIKDSRFCFHKKVYENSHILMVFNHQIRVMAYNVFHHHNKKKTF